ncbi:MAG: lipopolysaccharide biosynthesis protein [Planctomycetes bacterium]|nr:lipopolysaccharide biosynthesis protein [Planctomycetota bacterium]
MTTQQLDPPKPAVEHDVSPQSGRGIGRALGKSSAIYTGAALINKAIGFVLLPIYAHALTPAEYGSVAAVTMIGIVLHELLALAQGAAIIRFYHEHPEGSPELRRFVGTALTTVLSTSLVVGAALLVVGDVLLTPLLDGIPFWPLMAIGVGIAAVQPFVNVYLLVLQTSRRPTAFGIATVGSALSRTLLAIGLVAGLGWKAEGVLTAHLIAAAVVFAGVLFSMRGRVELCFDRHHAARSLRYSGPILVHTVGTAFRTILDRMFLVNLLGTAAAGVYHIGFQLSSLVQIGCVSAHKSLNPLFMRAMHEDDTRRLDNIRNLGLTLVVLYTFGATALSLAAPEVVALFASDAYRDASGVVPLLAFAFVASGIYGLLSNVLFFERSTSRRVGLVTLASIGFGAIANAVLIGPFGIHGAAIATLLGQLLFLVVVAFMIRRHAPFAWPYGRFAAVFVTGFVASLIPLFTDGDEISARGIAVKLAVLTAVFVSTSWLAWGSPWFLIRELRGGSWPRREE